MYSELFRIPIEWNGVPLFGVGVVLAAWLAIAGWGMLSTARQAGWPAALRAHLATLVIVAAGIAWLIPRYFPEGVPIRGYGLLVLAGSAAGIAMSINRARQHGISPDEIVGLAVAMFLCGILGARMFFVIEYWDSISTGEFLSTLKAALSYTEGGLVVYGALIGAMLAFAWYVRRRGLPTLAMADLIAPGMVAGLAFGRIGCLLNGCCYGGESDAPWAITFPRERTESHLSAPYADQAASGRFYGFRISPRPDAELPPLVTQVDPGSRAAKAGVAVGDRVVEINGRKIARLADAERRLIDALAGEDPLTLRTADGDVRSIPAVPPPPRCLPVHPAQIYSSVNAGLLAWFLWSIYPYRRRDGEVTALMITLYPIARFFEEIIRVDEPAVFGTGLSISQNISLVLLAGAAVMWLWLLRQPTGRLALPANPRNVRSV